MPLSEELVDVVDENDKVVERKVLRECVHQGLLHRAIVVILLDASEKMTFIQKRSSDKSFFAGRWSASCTGHVSSGETYLEGAQREVREELGLEDVKLHELFKFLSPRWAVDDKTEWEYITAFEGNTQDRKMKLQTSEVQEGKYVSLEDLARLVKTEENSFTPDSIIAFRKYGRLKL